MNDDDSPLGERERSALLELARASLRSALTGLPPPALPVGLPRLEEVGAAFVTLYQALELRGCVGTVAWDEPLHQTVRRVARAAALEDQRFSPVQIGELETLTIDISRLTPLRESSIVEIDLGHHGVCLERFGARGLFLPKVAIEHGWDVPMLLRQLCRKAMLPDEAWQDPATRLFTFTAEVFRDR